MRISFSEALESRTLFAAGDLDESFSFNGKTSENLGALADSATAVIVLPSGKILVAAEMETGDSKDVALLRFLDDGELDTTFGDGDGIATFDYAGGEETANAMLVLPSGKILVCGKLDPDGSDDDENTLAYVARFKKSGAIDDSYGPVGLARYGFAAESSSFNDIALDPFGKVVAVGTASFDGGESRAVVVRILSDGFPDVQYTRTNDGALLFDLQNGTGIAETVAVQANGDIIVGASANFNTNQPLDWDLLVLRVSGFDGELDTTFGDDGVCRLPDGNRDNFWDMQIDPAGRIFVTGNLHKTGFVAAVDPDGELVELVEQDFANDGASTDATSLTLTADNHVLVGYNVSDVENTEDDAWSVARYDRQLALDETFGEDGLVIGTFGAQDSSRVEAIALDEQGRIALVGKLGDTDTPNESAVALARIFGTEEGDASISGQVFVDRNENGRQNKRDKGINVVRVYVDLDRDKKFDKTTDPSILSDASGNFTIPGLDAGTYRVRQAKHPRLVRTLPSPKASYKVTVSAGEDADGLLFGNASRGEIIGALYFDLDSDFFFDFNEFGIVDVGVYLDLNNNGELDNDEPSTRSEGAGRFEFLELPAGTYVIRVSPLFGYDTPQELFVTVGPGVQSRENFIGYQPQA